MQHLRLITDIAGAKWIRVAPLIEYSARYLLVGDNVRDRILTIHWDGGWMVHGCSKAGFKGLARKGQKTERGWSARDAPLGINCWFVLPTPCRGDAIKHTDRRVEPQKHCRSKDYSHLRHQFPRENAG